MTITRSDVTTSADGTTIGYSSVGRGPAIVLVDGAMCYRGAGPMGPLADLLQDRFTVHTYDRRGRGESSDTSPYAVEREIEDLQAVIERAGGEVSLYAMSSGGALALAAAEAGPGIRAMVLYEPPYLAEVEDGIRLQEYSVRLRELLCDGHRGDAVALFMTTVGIPAPVVAGIRTQPGWAALEAIAPTLAYDDELLAGSAVPRTLTSKITVPVLVLSGSATPAGLQQAARATAAALPHGTHRSLEGQTHDVQPEAVAPELVGFFGS